MVRFGADFQVFFEAGIFLDSKVCAFEFVLVFLDCKFHIFQLWRDGIGPGGWCVPGLVEREHSH